MTSITHKKYQKFISYPPWKEEKVDFRSLVGKLAVYLLVGNILTTYILTTLFLLKNLPVFKTYPSQEFPCFARLELLGPVKGPGGARGLSAGQPVCTTPSSQMLKILWKSGAKHSANKPS